MIYVNRHLTIYCSQCRCVRVDLCMFVFIFFVVCSLRSHFSIITMKLHWLGRVWYTRYTLLRVKYMCMCHHREIQYVIHYWPNLCVNEYIKYARVYGDASVYVFVQVQPIALCHFLLMLLLLLHLLFVLNNFIELYFFDAFYIYLISVRRLQSIESALFSR